MSTMPALKFPARCLRPSMIQFRLTPCSSARREASSTTGPSATGSENGTPISITSAPLASSSSMMPQNVSSVGKPAVTKGMSAVRPAVCASRIFCSRKVMMVLLVMPPAAREATAPLDPLSGGNNSPRSPLVFWVGICVFGISYFKYLFEIIFYILIHRYVAIIRYADVAPRCPCPCRRAPRG